MAQDLKDPMNTISNTVYGQMKRDCRSEKNIIPKPDVENNDNVYCNAPTEKKNSYKRSLANIDYGKRSRISGLLKNKNSCDRNCSLEYPKQNLSIINFEKNKSSARKYLNPCRSIEVNRTQRSIIQDKIDNCNKNNVSFKQLPSTYHQIEIIRNEDDSKGNLGKKIKLKKHFADSNLVSKLMRSKVNMQKWKEFMKEREQVYRGNKHKY